MKISNVTFSEWRKSRYSDHYGGDCVELAEVRWPNNSHHDGRGNASVEIAGAQAGSVTTAIAIRDSKDPNGPKLIFTRAALVTAIDAISNGPMNFESRPLSAQPISPTGGPRWAESELDDPRDRTIVREEHARDRSTDHQ
ncbi:DUF397 domain-containing protein [Actinomadura fulvescens]|uniref:DUF397 domain-containing protein n=1 Tax=Actinomadura fulvescens TaxID=46160 RepID=A0ABP6C7N9_9ACTN